MTWEPNSLGDYDKYKEAIEQLHNDSDRAAGVVAGTIVEIALTTNISRRLHDHAAIFSALFRPSGPLGPFQNKIDLGFLMGIYPQNVYRELITIKDIRNDFAHKTSCKSFELQHIKAKCGNLKIFDKHTEEMRPHKGMAAIPIFLHDRDEKLKQPRIRYTLSAEVFSVLLSPPFPASRPPDPEPWMW